MQNAIFVSSQMAEVMEGAVFTLEELAHTCHVTQDWVLVRVQAEVLKCETVNGVLRFDGAALIRVRRIVQLEDAFDADLQLAALTTDLIEEVDRLRKQLKELGH